jgi:PPK2 family polyphosphate:nucleotide phosphotransferase
MQPERRAGTASSEDSAVAKKKSKADDGRIGELLRLPAGAVDLAAMDTRATSGFSGSKADSRDALAALEPEIADVQERLFAHGRSGGSRRLLLVLQGMDTSGKGGTMRHSVALMDPQGVQTTAYGPPTAEERRHDFLWRIRRRVPAPGMVGVFDRSHYEDVVIARVQELAAANVIGRRYSTINRFEQRLVEDGCAVVKVFLHISPEEQRDRLLARLDDPTKHWKYNPGDVDERARWDDYRTAYEIALERCSTDAAPWHVVPADRKWYRNWAVAALLLETLRDMALDWPPADFDVDKERRRVEES